MRMWMLPPELMCSRHIVGEHGEIHKFKKTFEKGHSIAGRMKPIVQIEPFIMKSRHDELASYLKNHKSPYCEPDTLYEYYQEWHDYKVDMVQNILDLSSRCVDCKEKIIQKLIIMPEDLRQDEPKKEKLISKLEFFINKL